MRRIAAGLLLAMVALSGCADRTSPVEPRDDQTPEEILAAAGPEARELASAIGPTIGGLGRLPAHLRLTTAQQEALRALFTAHATATQADRAALLALRQQLPFNGATPPTAEQRQEVQRQMAAILARIAAASAALETEILALLTAEQRAWIEANTPRRCDLRSLTREQHARIAALQGAFREAHAADLEVVRRVMEEAHAAHRAGRPRAEINAILAQIAEPMRRLAAAQAQLHAEVMAIAGCSIAPTPV